MNNVNLVGRVTKDLELKTSEDGQHSYTNFTLAVDDYAGKEKGRISSFIEIVAFGKKAEVLCEYITKGRELAITGKLQSGSYVDKEGTKKYNIKVILEDFNFVGSKKAVGENFDSSPDINNVPF